MEVQDNGVSFDVARAPSRRTNQRLGLPGMRERVGMLGGNVTIESAAGRGMTVRAGWSAAVD
jgi:signal transduction histidine kinase